MKTREQCSSSGAALVHCAYYSELDRILGGQEPMSAPVLVQTGLPISVQQARQEVSQEDVEEGEEEQQTQETVTLTLQPVPDTKEALRPSSDPGEGTSARPAAADCRATPVPPPTQSHSTCKHWRAYNDLLQWHVDTMEKMEGTMAKIQEPMAERTGRRRAGMITCSPSSSPSGVHVHHRPGGPGCARSSSPGVSSCPSSSCPPSSPSAPATPPVLLPHCLPARAEPSGALTRARGRQGPRTRGGGKVFRPRRYRQDP
nr:uncharacterized protein LOC112546627 [Pelodiscus sinensis]|eukprot:XP_025043117.1 uncharacterized protein LOC112546627 [Pelodiscus sinensis]